MDIKTYQQYSLLFMISGKNNYSEKIIIIYFYMLSLCPKF